ncbi:MAG: HAD-IIA family hydrolase [Gemmatimonadales bacterium]
MAHAFLFDLDGTLYTEAGAVPGAAELIARLRSRGTPFRFVTNTTSRTRAAIVERLAGYGIAAEPAEVFTALRAGAQVARNLGAETVVPFIAPEALADLADLALVGGTARPTREPLPVGPSARRSVLIGDLGARWSFDLLQEAFEHLHAGARLIALSRDRYWLKGGRLTLDAGLFVAGLEYAAGTEAVVAGKPNPSFFHAAVASLDLPPGTPVTMVGDDLWGDIQGAQRAGYRAVLVKTGKFRETALAESGIEPDQIVGTVGEAVGIEGLRD